MKCQYFYTENSPVVMVRFLYIINNMWKFKIFITILTLYEFVMLTILQVKNYCFSVFNASFCEYGTFKYFLMCIMLPGLCCILIWWLPNLSRFVCNKTCKLPSVPPPPKETFTDVLREIISTKDIERFITAAVIMGVQKFVQNHPKTQTVFDDILKQIKKTNQK